MDPEKRKRQHNDDETETVTRKRSSKPDEGQHAVREEEEEKEVEEFFAIVRRIQVAVKYFQTADGSGRKFTETMKTWKPSFEVEDFEGGNGLRDDGGVDVSRAD